MTNYKFQAWILFTTFLYGINLAELAVAQSPVQGNIIVDDVAQNTPKYGGVRTQGTQLDFTVGLLPSGTKYLVAIPEIRWENTAAWNEVGCRNQRHFRRHYSYTYPSGMVIARDLQSDVSSERISLFIPDEVLNLKEGFGDIRYKIEILDRDGNTIVVGRLPSVPVSVAYETSEGKYRFYRAIDPARKTVGVPVDFTRP